MSLLDRIKYPADLRRLKKSELQSVVDAARERHIDVVSQKGGHFGASLGVVEDAHGGVGGRGSEEVLSGNDDQLVALIAVTLASVSAAAVVAAASQRRGRPPWSAGSGWRRPRLRASARS